MNEKQSLKFNHYKKPIFSMLLLFGVMLVAGIFRMPYLYRFALIGLGALLVINVFLFFHGRSFKWSGFRYTRARFYLFLLFLLLPCIIIRPPIFFWIKFITFGILGTLGESILGFYCEQVFRKKFWIYRKDILFSGHSSWLNIILWGLGGVFYESLTRKALFAPTAEDLLILWTIFLSLFFIGSAACNFKISR